MAFHRDRDIIGTLADYLEVPDMVRFSWAHSNGSLMLGLRRHVFNMLLLTFLYLFLYFSIFFYTYVSIVFYQH
jgi:hypothetical protein